MTRKVVWGMCLSEPVHTEEIFSVFASLLVRGNVRTGESTSGGHASFVGSSSARTVRSGADVGSSSARMVRSGADFACRPEHLDARLDRF